MPFAIELFLDEQAESRVRRMWAALDEHGIPSLGALADHDVDPHVSLTAFDHGDVDAVADALASVFAAEAPFPLSLTALGFFLTPVAPVFLGVTPTAALLRVHRAVHNAVEPFVERMAEYYLPDALLPHCTLALGVSDHAAVFRALSGFRLPVVASAVSARLLEIPEGRPLATFLLGAG
ncbi:MULTISPECIES: 2'-5' RNA ligase family protein [Actinosynnema]|uniref:2'-5' RNA ligase family protein n=1 Tax=Actinosynnema pretiosum subsp. pretiosum TaxID=103721 RepID=A0AA45R3Q9_9PSEU|nr:2'-5' RNA ligase family protein [Actinosynnema pretiosum]AXX31919.1 hypothetical protein APASM_4554 [Actinosynnema pretiosum subsp. pretiosum]MCP2097539.1 2'-5' RNA ligase superfamily protein [Actinosynnema pretiosum]QUF04096.1 2'-5' RNA ligase family protein [Actinosynnema pretiosum subsp. pretiosum]